MVKICKFDIATCKLPFANSFQYDMLRNLGLIIPLLFILVACNQKPVQNPSAAPDAYFTKDSNFLPVAASGNVKLTVSNRDLDLQTLTIRVSMNNKEENEKVFTLALAKSVDTSELYKIVWDTAYSCYIAVLKADMQPRYYHASMQTGDLRILQVGTPPMRISDYTERLFGADSIGRKLVKQYSKRVQSGNILEDLKVDTRQAKTDSVALKVPYGEVAKTEMLAIPHNLNWGVLPSDTPDECDFGVLQDGRFIVLYNIKIKAGELRIKQLHRFSGVSADAQAVAVP